MYVPLARLQRDLNQPGKVNTILVGRASRTAPLERLLKQRYTLADVGLRLRNLEKPGCLSLESDSALIGDAVAAAALSAAQSLGLRAQPVLTYLVNGIRVRGREVPYSLVTALDSGLAPAREDGIALNDWAARELEAKVGDPATLEYYVWRSDARLHTETAQFRVERIVPLAGDAADPDFWLPSIPASPNPAACAIGTRRFHSTCPASAPPTSGTGIATAPLPKPSSASRAAAGCGARASAASLPSAFSRRPRPSPKRSAPRSIPRKPVSPSSP